jgi:signal transduction histidine kinase
VLEETSVEAADGEVIPVRFSGVTLRKGGETVGRALFLQDLREIKRLEQEKLDAERLAAVGQTVAGLAHGIKNILTGLEGGMYVVNTGLEKGRQDRIEKGWEMLERNIERISTLARSLLGFSKGTALRTSMIDPGKIVEDIAALYRDAAGRSGIRLTTDIEEGMAEAPLDPEGIHTCLANLVSNALDACRMSAGEGCSVSIRCREEERCIVYEVEDTGTGMDQDIKQKVFTSFFSTKGSGGTGLGLLLTRKIVQEHGGRISVESTPGEGSCFKLVFPRNRLPVPSRPEPAGEGT